MLLAVVPILPVRSVDTALAFYRDRLGFTVRHREGGLAILERDGVTIHLTQLDDERWRTRADLATRPIESGAESFIPGTASCRIQVDDAARTLAQLIAATVLPPNAQVREQWWGERDFGVVDPDGNLLTFFQRDAVRRAP